MRIIFRKTTKQGGEGVEAEFLLIKISLCLAMPLNNGCEQKTFMIHMVHAGVFSIPYWVSAGTRITTAADFTSADFRAHPVPSYKSFLRT